MPKRPEPTPLKLVKGVRKDRVNSEEPQPAESDPTTVPDHLPVRAAELWRRIAPDLAAKRVLTDWDREGLAIYCTSVVIAEEAAADAAERGILIQGDRGKVKNPALQILRDAAATAKGWAQEFGLTPSARSSIRVGKPADGKDAKRLLS